MQIDIKINIEDLATIEGILWEKESILDRLADVANYRGRADEAYKLDAKRQNVMGIAESLAEIIENHYKIKAGKE